MNTTPLTLFSHGALMSETIKLENERMKVVQKLNGMPYPECLYYQKALHELNVRITQFHLVAEAFSKESK